MAKTKNIENINKYKKCYFSAANSCDGFVNFFKYNFSPLKLNAIYIIKGGSGTGKSKFMQDIAEACEKKGCDVEYYYCSSDVKSLDGIILNDYSTAVIDGTAPHLTDPQYPGAVEKIINIGEFLDQDKLIAGKDEIIKFVSEKSKMFDIAYRYLKSANEIVDAVQNLAYNYLDEIKMINYIKRIVDKNFKIKTQSYVKTSESYKLIGALSASEYTEFDTFDKQAEKVFLISNAHFTGELLMKHLLEHTSHINKTLSPDPLNTKKINAVYFYEYNILFKLCDNIKDKKYNENNKYMKINMERFINSGFRRENKNRLGVLKSCYKSLIFSAVDSFKKAKFFHEELENIYKNAMDFKEKENLTKKIIAEIIK